MPSITRNRFLQRLVGGSFFERTYLNSISCVQLMFMKAHKNPDLVKLIRSSRRGRQSLQTAYEQYFVYTFASGCMHLPGVIAEVGVYQGVSARLLCDLKKDKPLHLFDTFEGLPKSHEKDRGVHRENQFAASLESVQDFLKDFDNVHYHKGYFPDSAADFHEDWVSFAHFDVDLYQSTLDCLKHFYPKMAPGGIMLSHDYSILSGVKDACHEFFADKPEPIIELPSTQCMIIKAPSV